VTAIPEVAELSAPSLQKFNAAVPLAGCVLPIQSPVRESKAPRRGTRAAARVHPSPWDRSSSCAFADVVKIGKANALGMASPLFLPGRSLHCARPPRREGVAPRLATEADSGAISDPPVPSGR
jgi:hypothetical protein